MILPPGGSMETLILYLLFASASCLPQAIFDQGASEPDSGTQTSYNTSGDSTLNKPTSFLQQEPSTSQTTGTQVQPWATCNQPALGINNLQCTDGYSCVCKDASYSQCRRQISGSWAPNTCWQCQQPTDKANGFLQSTLQGNDICDSSSSSAASGGDGAAGAGGSSGMGSQPSSTAPSTQPTQSSARGGRLSFGTVSSENDSGGSDSSDTGAGGSDSSGSDSSGSGTDGDSSNQPSNAVASSSPTQSPSSGTSQSSNMGSMSSPSDIKSLIAQYGNETAQVGTCGSVHAPSGWSVATTTYYNWMGTACLCGNGAQNAATWQSNTGPALGLQQGFYSGAVNNVLFKSRSKSALTCGETCGQCYDLVTSGTNAYVDGAGGGSLITMMVVDACYGQGAEKWCSGGPSSGPVQDTFGCTDHFDIQTDPTRSDVPATGMDGQEWSHGGQIVFYRETPGGCPPAMMAAFTKDCKPNCDGRNVN